MEMLGECDSQRQGVPKANWPARQVVSPHELWLQLRDTASVKKVARNQGRFLMAILGLCVCTCVF